MMPTPITGQIDDTQAGQEKTAENVDGHINAVVQNLPTDPGLQVPSTGLTDTTANEFITSETAPNSALINTTESVAPASVDQVMGKEAETTPDAIVTTQKKTAENVDGQVYALVQNHPTEPGVLLPSTELTDTTANECSKTETAPNDAIINTAESVATTSVDPAMEIEAETTAHSDLTTMEKTLDNVVAQVDAAVQHVSPDLGLQGASASVTDTIAKETLATELVQTNDKSTIQEQSGSNDGHKALDTLSTTETALLSAISNTTTSVPTKSVDKVTQAELDTTQAAVKTADTVDVQESLEKQDARKSEPLLPTESSLQGPSTVVNETELVQTTKDNTNQDQSGSKDGQMALDEPSTTDTGVTSAIRNLTESVDTTPLEQVMETAVKTTHDADKVANTVDEQGTIDEQQACNSEAPNDKIDAYHQSKMPNPKQPKTTPGSSVTDIEQSVPITKRKPVLTSEFRSSEDNATPPTTPKKRNKKSKKTKKNSIVNEDWEKVRHNTHQQDRSRD